MFSSLKDNILYFIVVFNVVERLQFLLFLMLNALKKTAVSSLDPLLFWFEVITVKMQLVTKNPLSIKKHKETLDVIDTKHWHIIFLEVLIDYLIYWH